MVLWGKNPRVQIVEGVTPKPELPAATGQRVFDRSKDVSTLIPITASRSLCPLILR